MRSVVIIAIALMVGGGICFLPNTLFRGNHLLRISSDSTPSVDRTALNTRSATLYVTLSPECPISKAFRPRLNQIYSDLADSPIEMIGVVPATVAETFNEQQFRNQFLVSFPVVLDHENKLCSQLDVTHVPQAVLVDPMGTIIYSGRIDDRFIRVADAQRSVTDDSLVNAISSFLTGSPVVPAQTTPVGCRIESSFDSRKATLATSQITYCNQVSRIMYRKCARCHRPGEVAPFSLLSYEETLRHALQIKEVVQQKLMPPWKPISEFGHFQNEQRLTASEIETICNWVTDGMPEGSVARLPGVPDFPTGWQLGTPDLELIMPQPFDIPADGPDIYQHFIIPTGLLQDRLVSGFEFRPGKPEVVHHAFAYYDTTGMGRKMDAADPGPGYSQVGSPGFLVSGSLGGWGPGGSPRQLPIGMGRPLPKGADLVLQVHYHPSGTAVQDQSRIGLYFAPEWTQRYVTNIMVSNVELKIPANASQHVHRAEWTTPVDTILLDITPHMHTLGKAVQAVAHLPDGSTTHLIRIDDWDFYWQDGYTFSKPLEFPAGTRIVMDCVFDNSVDNPLNPHSPPQDVYWGDFSDDEMGICYLQATTRNIEDYRTLNRVAQEDFQRQWDLYQQQKLQRGAAAEPKQ